MNPISLSWRFFLRDWRAGELGLLLAAVAVAVASIASVGFFVDRMRSALALQARDLMGADLVVSTDDPPPDDWDAHARSLGLRAVRTVTFPSMVRDGTAPRLASVKAVSEGYPLRGEVRVSGGGVIDTPASRIPSRGALWADPEVVAAVSGGAEAQLELGDARFRLEHTITYESDRGANFANFAPRVMIALDDLESTGLVQPASRVRWRLLVAGSDSALHAYQQWLAPRLARGQGLETIDSGRPELRMSLDRAARFLDLASLLAALIASVAVAMAARRFAQRHADGCAVMRAMGVRRSTLLIAFAVEMIWIAVFAGGAGVVTGWMIHLGLAGAVGSLIALQLPPPGVTPVVIAMASGALLLAGFGGMPLVRLASTAPLRVLRRELDGAPMAAWVGLLVPLAAFGLLLLAITSDRSVAMIALGGFAGAAFVFVAIAWLALRALAGVRRWDGGLARTPSVKLALASLSRRGAALVAQVVAVAVGLMALMLLGVTRGDLLEGWNRAVPADAPNRFLINIQPDQRDQVVAILEAAGVQSVRVDPMVRGRLVSINGRAVSVDDYPEHQARRLVDREFNLSFGDAMPEHNRIVEGRWFSAGGREASAEQGIVRTLGLAVGDELGFSVAGDVVSVKLTSVRQLAWDSMKVNFFMILSPTALDGAPATWITAYHQAPDREPAERELLAAMPNLTVFDTGNVIRQVRAVLDQISLAVQLLFVLTLAAGITVLVAAQSASQDERIREAGLMRALGASRSRLVRAQLWELGIGGGVAGLMAAAGALAVGWALATRIFGFEFEAHWMSLGWGTLGGSLIAVLAGWRGVHKVLASPPLATLRDA